MIQLEPNVIQTHLHFKRNIGSVKQNWYDAIYAAKQQAYIDGVVQDYSISSMLAIEILQSCSKSSI